jgi:dTMP kinase
MRGALVVFEGVEGAGKTTQVARLVARLERAGVPVVAFREPGGTPLGDAVRALLLDPAQDITPEAEALLFFASRAQLVQQRVAPALADGMVVVLDRFFLSTYAYQIAGRGLARDAIRDANRLAVGSVRPDVTMVLDLPAADGMVRAGRRSAADRMEAAGAGFHARVGAAFTEALSPAWQAAHPEAGRIIGVSAHGDEAMVEQRVCAALSAAVPALAPMLSAVPFGALGASGEAI